jgi:hypothetical protein
VLDSLLAESNGILEVVRLCCVRLGTTHSHASLPNVTIVDEQRALHAGAKVNVLLRHLRRQSTLAIRVEVYQVTWRKVHVLHVCALVGGGRHLKIVDILLRLLLSLEN